MTDLAIALGLPLWWTLHTALGGVVVLTSRTDSLRALWLHVAATSAASVAVAISVVAWLA